MTSLISAAFTGEANARFEGQGNFVALHASDTLVPAYPCDMAVRAVSGQSGGISGTFTASASPIYSDVIIRVSQAPAVTVVAVQLRTATGGVAAGPNLRLLSDGRIQIHSGSAALATSTALIPFNTWGRLTMEMASNRLKMFYYPDLSTTTPSISLDVGFVPPAGVTYDTIRFCNIPTSGSTAANIDFAWPKVDNASTPGPRNYVWTTLDKTIGIVPQTVAATVHTLNIGGTITYTINWADGTIVGPGSSATLSHSYTIADEYAIAGKATSGGVDYNATPVKFRAPKAYFLKVTPSGFAPMQMAAVTLTDVVAVTPAV